MKKEQLVIRTYSSNLASHSNLIQLQNLLTKGYEVKFVTPMEGYIEYILEKEITHKPN